MAAVSEGGAGQEMRGKAGWARLPGLVGHGKMFRFFSKWKKKSLNGFLGGGLVRHDQIYIFKRHFYILHFKKPPCCLLLKNRLY